jgi:hypothetical protein
MMRSNRTHKWAALVALFLATGAMAVAPAVGNMSPRGGQRSTEVEVRITGNNLGDAVDLMFHEPGLSLVSLEPESGNAVKATIAIEAGCAVGPKGLRVRTKSGVSNLFRFSVGNLPEINEAEPNNSFDEAQAIEMNTTVNGVVTNEDVDYFSVHLEAGQRIAVEVEALRLGGPLFDPKVRLFGPERHERHSEDDTAMMSQDAAFVYTTEETGAHRIAVSDSSYSGGGNWQYRLHVGNFPRPLAVSPMGGQPETSVKLAYLGDAALAEQDFAIPASALGTQSHYPETEVGVAPTPVPFRVSPFAGVMEVEPNNTIAEATVGAAPGAFDGVISEEGDVDWFSFEGKKDQVYNVRVWARALGSPLDSVLDVHKPSGGSLASDDDGALPDSVVQITLPEDGVYPLQVRDHLGRGGETFAYRVEVTPVEPGLRFQTGNNNQEAALTVHQGNRTFMMLESRRSDFDGPLAVAMEGLPAGVHVEIPPMAAGQTQLPLVLAALPEAPVAGALVPVAGKWADENQNLTGGIEQEVELVLGRNQTVFLTHQVNDLALAVGEAAPYIVEFVPPKAPVPRNGNKKVRIVAHRADGFNGEIELSFPFAPNGVGIGTGKIPAGQNETTLMLEGKGDAAVGVHQMVVEAKSAGYVTCTKLTPVEVTEEWVIPTWEAVQVEQGKSVEITVNLTHNREYEGTFEAQLANLPKGVTVEPLSFDSKTASLVYKVDVAADAPVGKHNPVFKTVITYQGEDMGQYRGGGQVQIFEPLPAELQEEAPKQEEEKKPDQPERKSRFAAASGSIAG